MDTESGTEGYEGVTHAGLLVVARDSGRMLLAQRAMDETDDPEVRETFEFPGGALQCVICERPKSGAAGSVSDSTASETTTASVSLDLGVLGREGVVVDTVGLASVDGSGSDAEQHVVTAGLGGQVAQSEAGTVLADTEAGRGVAGVVDSAPVRDRAVGQQEQSAVKVSVLPSDVGASVAGGAGGTAVEVALTAGVDPSNDAGGEQGKGSQVVHEPSVPPGLSHVCEWEGPLEGAIREFTEEVGSLPEGEVVHGWRAGDDGHYQGFVYAIDAMIDVTAWTGNDEVQDVGWYTPEEAATLPLRPEVAELDLAALIAYAVSGNEESTVSEMTPEDAEKVAALADTEPILTPAILADLAPGPVLVHGILCPEDTESGDGRGFNAGAVTARPLRLPFSWQKAAIGGHDGSVVVGSIDRVMRKDGLIHWEGSLLSNEEATEFIDLLVHFGRFGVSIDGDKGSLDNERSAAEQMTWFDAVRVAGTTAVAIPAFHEAYVALGPHPDMPADSSDAALTASGLVTGDIVGASTFDRGPGWVTNPKETKRLHDYWTKKGEPGYAKIAWGTNGDYTRCTRLVGEKIASNSPEDMRYLKRICAQWHHDALGYWPGDLDKPGNKTSAEARAERASSDLVTAIEQVDREDILATDDGGWEAVLVSSAGVRVQPPLHYFHRPEALDDWSAGALTVCDPDENGIVRTYGYAAEWGVCHIGFDGRCVEPPRAGSDDYPEFHLGITRTAEGRITTGVLTYGVEHRDAETILSESPQQCYFDNLNNAWASVRIGEDDRGIWFSGVVLPGVEADHLVKIEASGQVSGEWKHGALRACLTVNVPGFPVVRASASYDEDGNVLALAASAFGSVDNGTSGSECAPSPAERMAALRQAHTEAEAETRFAALKKNWEG